MFLCLHYNTFTAKCNPFFRVFSFSYKVCNNSISDWTKRLTTEKRGAKRSLRHKYGADLFGGGAYLNRTTGYFPSSVSFLSMAAVVARSSL